MAGPKLQVEIGAKLTELEKGLNEAGRRIQAFSSDMNSKMKSVGKAIESIAIPAGVASLAISGLGLMAVKSYGRLQSLEKGLEAVAGSSEAAKKQLDELREVAKLPGLGLEEAVKGSIALQAIGISSDQAKRSILQFGNAVATVGKGRAELDRALYGLQQLANTDFPLGEDLNIIKDAIPQVSKLLDEAFGANRSDALAKMGVTSKQVVETILVGLEKLPRVAGGIENAFENLGDGIKEAWQELGKAINTTLDFEGTMNKLGDALGSVVEWFRELSPAAQKTIVYIGAGIAAFTGLVAAMGAVITIAPLVAGALTLATGGIAALTAAITVGAVAIVNNWEAVKEFFRETTIDILLSISKLTFGFADLAGAVGKSGLEAKIRGVARATGSLALSWREGARDAKKLNEFIEMNAFINANAATNAAILAGKNKELETSLNGAGEAAKRVYKNYWALNAEMALNGKLLKSRPVQEKDPLRTLDRGVTIPIGLPNIQGIIPQVEADAQALADVFNDRLSETLTDGLAHAVSDIASGIGDALGKGGNLIDSLGAVFLGSMGGILKQLGEMAIQVGVGVLAVKKALQTLNPFVAIAAGVALVAIGSAFSSSARSLGGSVGGQGSQGSQTFTSGSVITADQMRGEMGWETMERNGDLMARITYGEKKGGR